MRIYIKNTTTKGETPISSEKERSVESARVTNYRVGVSKFMTPAFTRCLNNAFVLSRSLLYCSFTTRHGVAGYYNLVPIDKVCNRPLEASLTPCKPVFVCMNTHISATFRARASEFGANIYKCCLQLKFVLQFGHAHCRPIKTRNSYSNRETFTLVQ